MKSRIEDIEKTLPENPAGRLRSLFARWAGGEDVSGELDTFFTNHPELLHNPFGVAGKPAIVRWKQFTGHDFVRRDKHGIIGECECGFYPPKDG